MNTLLNDDGHRMHALSRDEREALVKAVQRAKQVQKRTGRGAFYGYWENDRLVIRPHQYGDSYKAGR